MAMGSAEEAAAPNFYKHTAVFPGFLFLGVWPPTSSCSFVPAIFLQDAGKDEDILCLCPRAVTLGRVRGKNAHVRKSWAPDSLERGSSVRRAQPTPKSTQSQNQFQVTVLSQRLKQQSKPAFCPWNL